MPVVNTRRKESREPSLRYRSQTLPPLPSPASASLLPLPPVPPRPRRLATLHAPLARLTPPMATPASHTSGSRHAPITTSFVACSSVTATSVASFFSPPLPLFSPPPPLFFLLCAWVTMPHYLACDETLDGNGLANVAMFLVFFFYYDIIEESNR